MTLSIIALYCVSCLNNCYAECRYAEYSHAECRYAECRYAECRGAVFTISLPTNVVLLWKYMARKNALAFYG